MGNPGNTILVINGGSSGIKFAVYNHGLSLTEVAAGHIEGIGTTDAFLNYRLVGSNQRIEICCSTKDINKAADFLVNRLREILSLENLKAIGHRIVYSAGSSSTTLIDDELLKKFTDYIDYDPEHFPLAITLIENLKKHFPGIPQIACFDGDFHRTMPAVASLVPLPQRFITDQVRRHGFHGISYSFLLHEMERLTEKKTAKGKIVLAHLGGGASICAVKNGCSMDTSMGFSTASGLPMATRTGDLDPGLIFYLLEKEKMTAAELFRIINHESGLAAISGTTGDMQELLKKESADSKAALAIEYFCYRAKKYIASYAAVLEGLETLIFSGGIGENSFEIRERICSGLAFLGIQLDARRNKNNEAIISADESKIVVRVMHTNEQLMIASAVADLLQLQINKT